MQTSDEQSCNSASTVNFAITALASRLPPLQPVGLKGAIGPNILGSVLHFKGVTMSKKLFVERRNQGDYAVRRTDASRASAVAPTQRKAIQIAREMGALRPDVERVRHTACGKPDQWRKA
jgi:hypothetical protein